MPYIEPNRQGDLTPDPVFLPINPGELNFVITKVLDDYLDSPGLSYRRINEVIGVLECAKLELYRRIAAPYEDGKMAENGDVYAVKP